MSRIVSCYLMGGLGNQLFQIFTTMAYGIKNSRRVLFPFSEKLTTGIERPTYWSNFLQRLSPYVTNGPIDLQIQHNETGFRYEPINSYEKNTILYGYFQSYLYFEEYRVILFSLIRLVNQKQDIREQFFELLSFHANMISMHFRLGDYKTKQDYHPIMPYEYYENALTHILSKRNNCNVLYFCEKEDIEDVEIIINKLKTTFGSKLAFVLVDDMIPDWQQMLIMSCCKDNIIANSSFSWWGAYFNQNAEQIVCYPSLWFGPKIAHDTTDLFPASWTKIEFSPKNEKL